MQLYLSPYTARDKGFLAHQELCDAQLGSPYAHKSLVPQDFAHSQPVW